MQLTGTKVQSLDSQAAPSQAICPIQGPVAITLTSPLLDDEVGWLDWLDCPLDDDELDIVVLLSLLVHPDAKTTKTKIPIIPNILMLNFFINKSPPIEILMLFQHYTVFSLIKLI